MGVLGVLCKQRIVIRSGNDDGANLNRALPFGDAAISPTLYRDTYKSAAMLVFLSSGSLGCGTLNPKP